MDANFCKNRILKLVTAGNMGIGLSEYRAIIGAFASIAVKAGFHQKTKSKQKKPTKLKDEVKKKKKQGR